MERRSAAADEPAADETQVIAPRQARPRRVTDTAFDIEAVDDRPHFVPGFDNDDSTTAVVAGGSGDTTSVNPGPNETLVFGGGTDADTTQVIPPISPDPAVETQTLPPARREKPAAEPAAGRTPDEPGQPEK
jgi:hypothetical protein